MSSTDLKLINSRGKRYTCPRHPTASVALGKIRTHTCIPREMNFRNGERLELIFLLLSDGKLRRY